MLTSMPISMSLYPYISQQIHNDKKIRFSIYQKYIFYVILLAECVSIVTFIFAPIIIKIMLGAKFLTSINIFIILSIQPLLISVASILTTVGLYSLNLEKYAPIVRIEVSIISTIIYIILIPKIWNIKCRLWIHICRNLRNNYFWLVHSIVQKK